jgi:hypothetical protein
MNAPEQPSIASNPPPNITSGPGKASAPAPEPGLIKLKHLSRVLNVPARWRILRELARGEALPVKELAVRARCPAASASKHMALLKKAGLVVVGYGRLYKLAPDVQPEPGGQRLDLGHCVLKLDTAW